VSIRSLATSCAITWEKLTMMLPFPRHEEIQQAETRWQWEPKFGLRRVVNIKVSDSGWIKGSMRLSIRGMLAGHRQGGTAGDYLPMKMPKAIKPAVYPTESSAILSALFSARRYREWRTRCCPLRLINRAYGGGKERANVEGKEVNFTGP